MPDSSGNYPHFGSANSWKPKPPKPVRPHEFSRPEFGFPSQAYFAHSPPPDFYTSMPYQSEFGTDRFPRNNSNNHNRDPANKSIIDTAPMQTRKAHSFDSMESRSASQRVIGGAPPVTALAHHSGYDYAYPAGHVLPPPSGPPPPYSYYHHHPPHHPAAAASRHQHHQPWPMMMSPPSFVSVEYIAELGPEDVLSGRGGATNSYKGNRAFRALVKEHQEQYLQAKKRDKPAVASVIVELIRNRGGRFLRRCSDRAAGNGQVLWVDIGDDRAREKTCQALREGAPEIRRRRRGQNRSAADSRSSSFDDEEGEDEANHGEQLGSTLSGARDTDATFSSPSSMDRRHSNYRWSGDGVATTHKGAHHHSNEEDSESMDDHTPEVRNGRARRDQEADEGEEEDEAPISIRPWARLIPDRPPVDPIALDQLSPHDRDLYLRDFLPPCPRSESQQQQQQQQSSVAQYPTGHDDNYNNNSSPTMMQYGDDYDYHSELDGKRPANNKAGTTWPLLTA